MGNTVVRISSEGRLWYYREKPDANFWDAHWGNFNRDFYQDAFKGSFGFFKKVYPKWLPREGKILEAGCGTAYYVVALRATGHDCEGVEWGQKTVERVKSLLPDLPVRQGDVTALDVPDGYYRGYISLGVMEHREEGPEPFLKEAKRVVADDGVLLISVPHFHVLRRLKAALGFYGKDCSGLEFYQYAFSVSEFRQILEKSGLQVVEVVGYDSRKGIRDEIPGFENIYRLPWLGRRICRATQNLAFMKNTFGHMALYVCKKSDG